MRRQLLFASVIFLITSLCASFAVADERYIVGPGDILGILVWGDNTLSKDLAISPDGYLSLPLVGEFPVKGMTIPLIREEITAMRDRIRTERKDGNPLKHGPGGLLDVEFVVQLGLLINADDHPEVIESTKVNEQLKALLACGWINDNAFNVLDNAYTQLSHAIQQAALVDDSADVDTAPLLGIAQALCNEILG